MEREEVAAALRKLTFGSGSRTFPVYTLSCDVASVHLSTTRHTHGGGNSDGALLMNRFVLASVTRESNRLRMSAERALHDHPPLLSTLFL